MSQSSRVFVPPGPISRTCEKGAWPGSRSPASPPAGADRRWRQGEGTGVLPLAQSPAVLAVHRGGDSRGFSWVYFGKVQKKNSDCCSFKTRKITTQTFSKPEDGFGRESQVPRKTHGGGSQQSRWQNSSGALRAGLPPWPTAAAGSAPASKASTGLWESLGLGSRQEAQLAGRRSGIRQRIGRTKACQAAQARSGAPGCSMDPVHGHSPIQAGAAPPPCRRGRHPLVLDQTHLLAPALASWGPGISSGLMGGKRGQAQPRGPEKS